MNVSLHLLGAVFVTALFTTGLNGQTQSPASVTPPADQTTTAAPVVASPPVPRPKLLYKPPAGSGSEKIPNRVSGGARGGSTDASLLALVPDHAALTTQAQPSLFWFQSRPAKASLEITLVEPNKAKPLLALKSDLAKTGGIQRVKLSDYKIELKPGVTYEWAVAIVPDPANRSQDVVAKGTIKRVERPADLPANIESMEPLDRAAAYAQAGIWYDALEAVSSAVDAHPDDSSIREQRAALLSQVGLSQAVAVDQKKQL